MLQLLIGLLAWALIVMFLWEVGWKGRAIIIGLVLVSVALPYAGGEESVYLFAALGFAIRVAIACAYLIKRKLLVVSP